MIYKLHFIFFLLYSNFLGNHASKMEEIIGGYRAPLSNFRYQTAIVGKYNYSDSIYLLCSAGILNDYLLISAGRCFVHKLKELKKHSFFAVIEEDILLANNINLKAIELIYTYNYNIRDLDKDLAIIRLRDSLNLQNSLYLIPLEVPHQSENFHGQTGFVAGYGIDSIENLIKHGKRERIRLASKYGLVLKYVNVTILSDGEFRHFPNDDSLFGRLCGDDVNQYTEICGTIPPDENYGHRGVCLGDNGAPLVIDNKVVGILSKHNVDCDDTVHGSIYTKISNFKNFINALIEGRPRDGTTVYVNPPHFGQTNISRARTSAN